MVWIGRRGIMSIVGMIEWQKDPGPGSFITHTGSDSGPAPHVSGRPADIHAGLAARMMG